ncbi:MULTISPECIES: hypothetical protein [Micromonospora]|uniref:Uncharacterized protein n=1 Tax=Micromonospora solifontis TaxID=2487138 RepID=A0ABX9WEF3_9ACTN|nr:MULTISPECIES: hypothetical protein [Micromonospora]NES16938.1 hypothetical protein [Micromonospora sp. PPF5-17B]NES38268.1 hypothetical protein [Micromonospora solifontis]NES58642.1 hypothetical protein [Micromonospora sp. PPF5-6]RNL96387.1 hypothetical protein EFE23_19240 [Micromonospora solifontis]
MINSGDLFHVARAASVQFVRPIMFRVIRVLDWPTYDGWAWLDGYELNSAGDAAIRRSIFVQPAGLRKLAPEAHQQSAQRKPMTRIPVRVL